MSNQWQSGLFGCFNDCGICCVACCFPCVQYGLNQDKLNPGSFFGACLWYMCCPCCVCCFHTPKRFELRQRYNLPEEPCGDCLVVTCCQICALVQEGIQLNTPVPQRQTMY